MSKLKRRFYFLIHFIFISGFLYAFYHFIQTPKSIFLDRRLWAYESWIILSFYSLFVYLVLWENEVKMGVKMKNGLKRFQQVMLTNLLLLIFPWGLFLILAPKFLLEIFHLSSIYWRILGIGSMLGALIYYFPFRFYQKKFSYYILAFGFVDNLLAGAIVVYLFISGKVPLVAFSTSPLLFYFAFFFLEQARDYKK